MVACPMSFHLAFTLKLDFRLIDVFFRVSGCLI